MVRGREEMSRLREGGRNEKRFICLRLYGELRYAIPRHARYVYTPVHRAAFPCAQCASDKMRQQRRRRRRGGGGAVIEELSSGVARAVRSVQRCSGRVAARRRSVGRRRRAGRRGDGVRARGRGAGRGVRGGRRAQPKALPAGRNMPAAATVAAVVDIIATALSSPLFCSCTPVRCPPQSTPLNRKMVSPPVLPGRQGGRCAARMRVRQQQEVR